LATHTGLLGSDAHSLLFTQATHLPLVGSHTAAAAPPSLRPAHWLLAVHAAHWLLAPHTGFVGSAVHSLLFTQTTHLPLVGSHTLAPAPPSLRPEQSLLPVHFAHLKFRHMGKPAGHCWSIPQVPGPSTGRVSTVASGSLSN
jgi:hypothetical protein